MTQYTVSFVLVQAVRPSKSKNNRTPKPKLAPVLAVKFTLSAGGGPKDASSAIFNSGTYLSM
jgi:hypothetical protein